ncbi:hypothetical protein LSUE1_G000921 [Lachnellula suecica]|uniref:N-acetyltransferase domain-containing protein n=1 Tax=Lachnellula suecica TaxID=602035 RepID=A0A8T9CMI1_9HELO|nr:hypothetical protein LSUE1_G000921 [Lachnellula suecica]
MPFELHEVQSAPGFAEIIQDHIAAFNSPPNANTSLVCPILGSGPTAEEDALKSYTTRQWYRHRMDPNSHWLKIVDTDTGLGVAGACWIVVDAVVGEGYRPMIEPFGMPEGERREFTKGVLGELAEVRARKEMHVALQAIFIHPDYRRKGVASLLMGWVLAKADQLKLDCFVEGTEIGVPLYSKHGFVLVERRKIKPVKKEEDKSEEWHLMERTLVPTLNVMRRSSQG